MRCSAMKSGQPPEDLYANDESGLFARLTENFSGDRSDDGLAELVQQTYTFANATPDPAAWLAAFPNRISWIVTI